MKYKKIAKPLFQQGLINNTEKELFFSGINKIIKIHAQLLSFLRNQQEEFGTIDFLFNDVFDEITFYLDYAKQNPKRIKSFEKKLEEEKFNDYFGKCWKDMSRSSNFSINNYFNLPIYHLTNQLGILRVNYNLFYKI